MSELERQDSKAQLHSGTGTLYAGASPIVPPTRFNRFVAACAARLRNLLIDEPGCQFLDTFQRHAEGEATQDDVRNALARMHAEKRTDQRSAQDYLAFLTCETPLAAGSACWNIACAISWATAKDSIATTCAGATEDDWFDWSFSGGPPDPVYQATKTAEYREQANLLHEVIGNPFRPVTLDPSWLAATVQNLAAAIYEERAFDRLPILADALEDAGCGNQDILGHCRSGGEHMRGCWVLDLLLQKE
jgi:hypothetical protein